jgi:DNA repair protein RadC
MREELTRNLNAVRFAIGLVRNHPSGDPKPSRDDIEMTREIGRQRKCWASPSTTTW